ncbi:shikimate dehydrogenase [Gorillibacterium massiliense]|uniref:shikimate dehydrogenase n=1 Tax=Gorillibacterium massiliense TaxID=1280390 RepID=UPI0004B2A745|nr:shikimate dehydrogenase [Gorillibacterium massiliense]
MSVITHAPIIDTGTRLFGVFGDPVGHSKSPLMLNRAFSEKGINAVYAAFHIKPGTLKDAIAGIRALGYGGVNVTIPHKLEVMDYLDEIDEAARRIGAVNTVVNRDGRLIGYNTDGIGYVRSLIEETGCHPKGKCILMVGAGGAARAIAFALAAEGAAEIVIANRTPEKAQELAQAASGYGAVTGIGLTEVPVVMERADIVINTTRIGMHPMVDETPIRAEWIRPGMLVSDIVYNPRITLLLKEAEARGARIHSGLGMFIYQGAYAFEYWTGDTAPVAAMREAVEQALGA